MIKSGAFLFGYFTQLDPPVSLQIESNDSLGAYQGSLFYSSHGASLRFEYDAFGQGVMKMVSIVSHRPLRFALVE
jgi:hypothetical protein